MNDIVLSIDIDWAPDFMIEQVLNILTKNNSKATWFITHESDLIEEIRKNSNFELAIHPNFLSNSSQGKNYYEILENLLKIVPESKTVRTHALFYHHYLLELYIKYGIKYDTSIYLKKVSNIVPFEIVVENKSLIKIPFFWSEECNLKDPVSSSENGLKVFCFHPVHVFLNSRNSDNYNKLKNDFGITKCTIEQAKKYINDNEYGSKDFINLISKQSKKTIKQIGEEFLNKIEH